MQAKKIANIQAGPQIINVFRTNLIEGFESEMDGVLPGGTYNAAAFETGRKLLHYGYIVTVLGKDITGDLRYFIGADKLGKKFFKELFGTNIDMFVGFGKSEKPDTIIKDTQFKPKEEKEEEKQSSKIYGITRIGGSTQFKKELFDEIKKNWGVIGKPIDSNKISEIKRSTFKGRSETYTGLEYKLNPYNTTVGVYYSSLGKLVLVYFDNKKTINAIKKLGLFDNFESIDNITSQIFHNVDEIKDLAKL